MKRFILPLFLMISCLFNMAAQEKDTVDKLASYASDNSTEGWKFGGIVGLTFGQTSLTNWSAGGDNTVSGDFTLNVSANYMKDKWFWDNSLAVEYGMVYSSSYDWQKASDKLNLTSIAGRGLTDKWSVAFLLNFKTQFSKGYDYPDEDHYISTFMAPGYLDGALGFTYKPNAKYTVFLSPIAERATFVLNDSLSNIGSFGVDPGKKVLWQTGAYAMATTKQDLMENISLISTLDLFTPYNKDFGNVDVNWDILINCKINKLFTATLNTTLRYYDKEIQKVQFKEILGLGFTYSF